MIDVGGVSAPSLCRHVANKDEILAGVVREILLQAEVSEPSPPGGLNRVVRAPGPQPSGVRPTAPQRGAAPAVVHAAGRADALLRARRGAQQPGGADMLEQVIGEFLLGFAHRAGVPVPRGA